MRVHNSLRRVVALLSAAVLCAVASAQMPLGTAFTYQGQLKDSGIAVNGTADFRFWLYDAATLGTQIGTTQTMTGVSVNQGLFTVSIDFGAAAFDGDARWLQVAVRHPAGSGAYQPFGARQPVTATPYALYSAAPWATSGANLFYNGGRVGIGTASPVDNLTVSGTGTAYSAVDGAVRTRLFSASAGSPRGYVGTSSNHPFVVRTADADRMVVDTSGNVLIGTTNLGGRISVGSTNLSAIYGENTSAGNAAIYGTNSSSSGTAIHGITEATTGSGIGVFGRTAGDTGRGVVGYASSSVGATIGVSGFVFTTDSSESYGVRGLAGSGANSWGVYAVGRVGATGTKSFQIDHPLDPSNKFLNHYCAEAPEPLNVYSGNVVLDSAGRAVVQLPDYFAEINRDFRYQLTCIGGAAQVYIAREVANNQFEIAGGTPGLKVSWEVKGVRNDRWVQAYGAPVESMKSPVNRGKYLHPELFDQPADKAIGYQPLPVDANLDR